MSDATTVGQEIALAMPTDGSVGSYVYVLTDGSLTCVYQAGINPTYIKMSDSVGIVLDGGSVDTTADSDIMYAGYIKYVGINNPVAVSMLKLHIQEITNLIMQPYAQAMGGNNYNREQLTALRGTLRQELSDLMRSQISPLVVGRTRRY